MSYEVELKNPLRKLQMVHDEVIDEASLGLKEKLS